MGSLEEEKLAEMVRDFIESESTTTLLLPISQNPIQLSPNPTFLSLQEILMREMDCESEVNEKILRYLKDMDMDMEMKENVNGKKKCILGRLKMDIYEASLCKTSWVSAFGRPFPQFSAFGRPSGFEVTGNYEYIDVMMKDENGGGGGKTRLIIDMDFRSQFELVRPTESYTQLKNALPLVFVGTEGKLKSIINLLCSAAKQSLEEKGLHIPPWRKVGYMKSKWFSHNCQKFSFPSMV